MRKLIYVIPLLLAGCASNQIELSKGDEDTAKVAILKAVRNPDSIVFGPMVAARAGSATTVCGKVNGTNGFGGYTGLTVAAVRIYDDGSPPSVNLDNDSANLQCVMLGLKSPPQSISAELLKKHHID